MKTIVMILCLVMMPIMGYADEKCYPIESKTLYIFNYYPNDRVDFRFRSQEKPRGGYLYTQYMLCYYDKWSDAMEYCEVKLPKIFEDICIKSKGFYHVVKGE